MLSDPVKKMQKSVLNYKFKCLR